MILFVSVVILFLKTEDLILQVKISLSFVNPSNRCNLDKGTFNSSICNNSLSIKFLPIY